MAEKHRDNSEISSAIRRSLNFFQNKKNVFSDFVHTIMENKRSDRSMRCRKWWLWFTAAVCAAAVVLAVMYGRESETELPRGTLVKVGQEVRIHG